MIAIRGANSRIAQELMRLLPSDETVDCTPRDKDMPLDADRYLFCQGLLRAKRGQDQAVAEIEESTRVNLWFITDQIDRVMLGNVRARVCVIGSESGYSGSFDGTYAMVKAALHRYVETKRLKYPNQQLYLLWVQYRDLLRQ